MTVSVYVDELVKYARQDIQPDARQYGRRWCQLTADSVAELHLFALKIGVFTTFFRDHRVFPHYDLSANKRNVALRQGAMETTTRERLLEYYQKTYRGVGR